MGTSKILIDGVGIDLTADTVAANKMLSGTKAHDSSGDVVTGNIPSKAAATYTPGTSAQTIAAGQYLDGTQTIQGDADLVAENIKSGVNIFGVAGTLQPAKTEQSKTLTLGAAAPDTVTPDSGKVLSSVLVTLDTNVIKAANIASGVTMLGIAGTHQGGGGTVTYSVLPETETWEHNQWVTLGIDIDENGGLTVYKESGSGTVTNPRICYPQSDTYDAGDIITAIDFPQVAGNYELPITVWWDNGSTVASDHSNHTITYTVVSSEVEPVTPVPLTVTENGTYTAPSGKAYTPVTVNVSGGGSDRIGTATKTGASGARSIEFNVSGAPKWFFMYAAANINRNSSSQAHTTFQGWDGTRDVGTYKIQYTAYYSNSIYSHTYSNGTLTVNMAKPSQVSSYYYDTVSYVLVYGY